MSVYDPLKPRKKLIMKREKKKVGELYSLSSKLTNMKEAEFKRCSLTNASKYGVNTPLENIRF